MRDVQDLMSGIHYLEMTSRPKEEPVKEHSTIMEGLGIVGGFILCMLAIVIAI
ncbi:MAG: hypothetical protein LUC17_00680 [Oscillospiraceae bacterium]|nr:hypothetical protein [Oscillospiraceae bacterium]